MISAIMQPTYFPWAGYFNLINKVDTFFFLDDAQFVKESWHNRNRILRGNTEVFITIPLKKKSAETAINNCLVFDHKKWKIDHKNIIYACYSKHPNFNCVNEILESFTQISSNKLSEINTFFIKFICEKLSIKCNFINTSEVNIFGKRTERTIKILQEYNIKKYISPQGSKQYLADDRFIEKCDIVLEFSDFFSKEYNQFNNKNFKENLSIIDVIANLGWKETKKYITNDSDAK